MSSKKFDKTINLKQIRQECKNIYDNLTYHYFLPIDEVKSELNKFVEYLVTVKKLYDDLLNNFEDCKLLIKTRITKISEETKTITLPQKRYIGHRDVCITEGQELPIKRVLTLSNIPNYPLYYLHHSKEFVIKIANITFRGNLQNFQKSNWIYTEQPWTKKNNSMRHIGDKKNLQLDILRIKQRSITHSKSCKHEINMRLKQLMHDLLIIIILKENSLL